MAPRSRKAPEYTQRPRTAEQMASGIDILATVDAVLLPDVARVDPTLSLLSSGKPKTHERAWQDSSWGSTLALGGEPRFPTALYKQFGDATAHYRVSLIPRLVYVAQLAAKEKGIDFERLMQTAIYDAFVKLGVSLDSQAGNDALLAKAEGVKDLLFTELSVSDVYVDEGWDPVLPHTASECVEVKPPSIAEFEQHLDQVAESITRLRNLKKYDSIYAAGRPDKDAAKKELELVVECLPSSYAAIPVCHVSLKSLYALLRSYEAICKQELNTLLKTSREPMRPGFRAALLARAKKAAEKDRLAALKSTVGLTSSETEYLVWAGDLVNEDRAARAFDNKCGNKPVYFSQISNPIAARFAEIREVDLERRLLEMERLTITDPKDMCVAVDIALMPISATWQVDSYADRRVREAEKAEARAKENNENPVYKTWDGRKYRYSKWIRDMRFNNERSERLSKEVKAGLLAISPEWVYISPEPYIDRANYRTDPLRS